MTDQGPDGPQEPGPDGPQEPGPDGPQEPGPDGPQEPGPHEPGHYGQPGFGQPGQQGPPVYGQPSSGQPGSPSYGQPGPPSYGQPGPPSYGQPGPPGYGQPGYAGYGTPTARPSQNANVALGLSIGGLATYVVGFCCGPFALVGAVLCGVGLYMGYRETQAIEAGMADPAGRGAAKGAQIVGGIGVGLAVIGLVLIVIFIGASAIA